MNIFKNHRIPKYKVGDIINVEKYRMFDVEIQSIEIKESVIIYNLKWSDKPIGLSFHIPDGYPRFPDGILPVAEQFIQPGRQIIRKKKLKSILG